MRFSTSVSASLILLLTTSVFGAPIGLHTVQKYSGKVNPGSYIVTLKSGVDRASVISDLGESVTHEWDAAVNGFAGKFDGAELNALRSNSDIESIAEDGFASIFASVTQTDAPWGIARLSQTAKLASQDTSSVAYTYTYDDSAGAGVDVYVIDTGIYTAHSDFGGRAKWGATFGGYADADGNGHGTHVSGTVAGNRYGVAKAANLIAVKVLSDGGSGAWADVISGLDYALTSAQASGRPSIATLSLGGGAQQTVDDAVAALTAGGVHVTVAAGNDGIDAGTTSPARAPSANTIGATTIGDALATYSNYGPVVDLLAPGTSVTSDWIGSTTATNTISGTSMATPHVAGLIAYIIGLNGNSSPANISQYLKDTSAQGLISSVPSTTLNDLAHIA